MQVNIIKDKEDSYILELQSGHFSGRLTSIKKELLQHLISTLNDAINSDSQDSIYTWNPRSQRHELIKT